MSIEVKNSVKPIDYVKSMKILEERVNDVYRGKKEEFLSQIIERLNELFITDQLTENDMVNYAYTVRDKLSENIQVMQQIANNSPEQAMLGDFAKAIDDAILDSSAAHQNQMMLLIFLYF